MASDEAHKRVDDAMADILAELPDEDEAVPADQGVPSWMGPNYRPTDEAIEAFAEPPPGA